jgi:hypothetical protein
MDSDATNASKYFATVATVTVRNKSTGRNHQVERLICLKKDGRLASFGRAFTP